MKMLPRMMLVVASIAGTNMAAGAATISVGGTLAKSCFRVAAAGTATRDTIETCDAALAHEAMAKHDRVATHVNRGVQLMHLGDLDRAAEDFRHAQALDPDEPEVYLNQAFLLIRQESAPKEARSLFDEAISRRTRRPELAYYGRAIAAEMIGDVRGAYSDYKRASELAPQWKQPTLELTRFSVRRRS